MRLWHQKLVPFLPREQLLGQHREICALRGNGWKKKHSVVNYVFLYPYSFLYYFHLLVIKEMENRGYHIDEKWRDICYRGKVLEYDYSDFTKNIFPNYNIIYPEHNEKYLNECLDNLANKNIYIDRNSFDKY